MSGFYKLAQCPQGPVCVAECKEFFVPCKRLSNIPLCTYPCSLSSPLLVDIWVASTLWVVFCFTFFSITYCIGETAHATVHAWQSQGNQWKSTLAFYLVCGNQLFYLLNHVLSLIVSGSIMNTDAHLSVWQPFGYAPTPSNGTAAHTIFQLLFLILTVPVYTLTCTPGIPDFSISRPTLFSLFGWQWPS